MALTLGQYSALENLARKAAGGVVDWINIANARALTAEGLAVRDRQGWRITPAGVELVARKASNDAEWQGRDA